MTPKITNGELALAQALGEMTQASRQMATTMEHMNENLKLLNDKNILHSEQTAQEHKSMMLKLDDITKKYWWLILVLLAIVFLILGYKEVLKFLPGAP
jgi:hypothetical protein